MIARLNAVLDELSTCIFIAAISCSSRLARMTATRLRARMPRTKAWIRKLTEIASADYSRSIVVV